MKLLPTLLVSLLTIGLGFLAVMQQRRGNLEFIFGSQALESGEVVYKFNPADVGRIQILNYDGTRAEVVRTDKAWMLKAPWNDYADARVIRSLIDFAARLQIEDVIKKPKEEDFTELGLSEKDRIQIEFFDTSGNTLCHFRIGRYTSWRGFDPNWKNEDPTKAPPSFPTLIIQPAEDDLSDHLYVCSDFANPALRTILIRDFFTDGLRIFRDRRLFHNSPLFAGQITLKEKTSEITLRRENLTDDNEWKIDKPYQLSTSPKAMKQLINGLATIQAAAVVDESDIALPPPLPENIDFTISMAYFQKDGSLGPPVTAKFYPPQTADAQVVPVVIAEGPEKNRAAILLVPTGTGSLLASLPRNVNTLRSRTMTAMRVSEIEGVTLRDFSGRTVDLTLEIDPHERAARWHSRVTREDGPDKVFQRYQGPANQKLVFDFFQVLFENQVVSFTNDASTSPEEYGLDQPIRRITLTPKKGDPINFVIGEKFTPKYYARRAPKGRVIPISEDAYEAGIKNQSHPELESVAQPTTDTDTPPTGLGLFGLSRPSVIKVKDTTLHLGKVISRRFFANRLDQVGQHTPHVVEISPEQVDKMPLADFHWRGERLWNINRFEISGLVIEKRGEPALELFYNFYAPAPWTATQGSKDVTALLNTNKADKLLRKITDIEVFKWQGPVADNAGQQLLDPSLSISILIEEISDEGIPAGLVRRQVKFAETKGRTKRFYFGKCDTIESYFLLDEAVHQRLSVDLLDE